VSCATAAAAAAAAASPVAPLPPFAKPAAFGAAADGRWKRPANPPGERRRVRASGSGTAFSRLEMVWWCVKGTWDESSKFSSNMSALRGGGGHVLLF
jgi:hypothetical protein